MDMTDMTRAAVSRRHFLRLAGAGMLALTGTALTGCGNSTSGEGSDKGSKLAAIKSRGHLNAGVKKDVPGYGYYDTAKGRFEGMEVDLCYQIAAAVFGVSYKEARAQELVEFNDVTPKTRGPLIDNGQLDVVAATYTITDERKKSWDFSTPYRTDYVGLMVKKRSGFTSIEDLDGKVIGVSQGFGFCATMRYIILPQTFKTIIPALFSQCTTVIKDSSYLSGINVAELMYTANVVMAHAIDLSQVLMLYGLVFAMYFVLNFGISLLVRAYQRRIVAA